MLPVLHGSNIQRQDSIRISRVSVRYASLLLDPQTDRITQLWNHGLRDLLRIRHNLNHIRTTMLSSLVSPRPQFRSCSALLSIPSRAKKVGRKQADTRSRRRSRFLALAVSTLSGRTRASHRVLDWSATPATNRLGIAVFVATGWHERPLFGDLVRALSFGGTFPF